MKQRWRSAVWRKGEWPWLVTLLALTTLVWCAAYRRWSVHTWTTPITYGADAWWGMAAAKAAATGEIVPVLPKYIRSLGAPFEANWNDYPSADEATLALMGLLARLFGVFAGANISVLLAQLLAAFAFYFVCRWLRYDRLFSIAGAVLFAFSRYAFSRGLLHLGLVYYWHIPLGILVVWWCMARQPLLYNRLFAAAAIIAALHASQNPYYTAMFGQLLLLAALYHVAGRSRWQRVLPPMLLIGVTGVTFALMHADTFYSYEVHGAPAKVVERNYSGLEFYALKPVELLLPVVHQVQWLHDWARQSYYAKTMLIGEAGSPYLGAVGVLALVWLAWTSFGAIAQRQNARIPGHTWLVVWVMAYSVVGGINGVVGFAVEVFRGTNRYSIVILTLLLLFLVRQLTGLTRSWHPVGRSALATVLVAVGLFDQIPPALAAGIAPTAERLAADRQVVQAVEAQLPARAMLFQLPVAEFPEAGAIGTMGDYEHFRPYLHSQTLRFSYGNTRGRTRDAWQREAVGLGVPYLTGALEKYGFSAVWINRNGYDDRGASLIAEFNQAGRSKVLAQNAEFVCMALFPSAQPRLPAEFARGWHSLEGQTGMDWRWSSGNAEVVLHNPDPARRPLQVSFDIETPQPRIIDLAVNGQRIFHRSLTAEDGRVGVNFPVVFSSPTTLIRFQTDVPGQVPGNGDPRKLAFRVLNFQVLH